MLVDEWICEVFKTKTQLKFLLYKQRNQISCKMITAGSVMDAPVRNVPSAFNQLEIAVQIQKRPIQIGKDRFFVADKETGALLLRPIESVGPSDTFRPLTGGKNSSCAR